MAEPVKLLKSRPSPEDELANGRPARSVEPSALVASEHPTPVPENDGVEVVNEFPDPWKVNIEFELELERNSPT